MKAVFRKTLFVASLILAIATSLNAQRVIKGTVYREGKPAAGVTVEAHRGGTMMTSFDGKYEVEADNKTKWLRFTFINESTKFNISDKTGDVFDFAFDGIYPDDNNSESGDIVLKSLEELVKEQDREYLNQLSLYTEFYKQGNYESALPHWKEVYNKYPKSSINVYIQGANMIEKLIEKADSPEKKSDYIDKLMKLYDKRIKYFGEKGYVLGRKATSWLKFKLENDKALENGALTQTLKTGYDWLDESIKEAGDETEMPVLLLLMQTSRSLFKLGELPKETVVRNYDKCNSILTTALKSEDKDLSQKANEVQPYIEDIFGSSGAADCEALVNIYTPQFEENKNDIDFIKGMLRRLGSADCDKTSLFSDASERLYELEPSAEAAFNMARRYVEKGDNEKAKKYYKQAMEQEKDKNLLAKYYYEYALFVYAKGESYPEARDYARKAININPNYCEALMLIGEIYVAGSRNFGKDSFDKSSVFWVAVDYFQRARANADCAVDASKKIKDYRQYFPNKEEAFFRSLQEGQTYKVGGWINETTKVRF